MRASAWWCRRHQDHHKTAAGSGGAFHCSHHSRRRTSGTVSGIRAARARAPDFFPRRHIRRGPLNGQEGMCPKRQRHVAIPSRPAAYFILVEPDLALGALKAFFDRPATAGGTNDLGERGLARREDGIVGDLLRVGDAASEQDAVLPAARPPTTES